MFCHNAGMLKKTENPSQEPLLQASGLTYSYGKVLALDGLSLDLRPGGVTALLGPNGAGKTTLINLMLGILPVTQGQLKVMGLQPRSRACKQQLGAMLQISGVQDNLTVLELMNLFASFYPNPSEPETVLPEAGLVGLENRQYRHLSGGQRQRVLYALAVIGDPSLLILDEPTTGLDPAARHRLWQAIEQRRDKGGSVLLCTHYLDEAERLADHIVVLDRGKLRTKGSSEEVRNAVPRKQINCKTTVGASQVRSLPGVQKAIKERQQLMVLASEAEPVVRFLLEQDRALKNLEVERASLETAFLALTTKEQEA